MSIRFAAPASRNNPLRAIRKVRSHPRASNDNGRRMLSEDTAMLQATLRHFAEHGLAAADEARQNAQAAACRGDEADLAKWREICSTLDRRLARELDRQLSAKS